MTKAYSYACRDCEGMEACPASVVAESRQELVQLIEYHAQIAHDEDPVDWDTETRNYVESLIKEVDVKTSPSVHQ